MPFRRPRQDSLTHQLVHVSQLAVQAGCYDADDVIRQHLEDEDEGTRYFLTPSNSQDHTIAVEAVWTLERYLGISKSSFLVNAPGLPTQYPAIPPGWTWTNNLGAQRLYRAALIHMGATFEELDEQQIALLGSPVS